MPLQLIRADITTVKCDAIVNAANSTLLGGGGVDGAIHRAACPNLLKECKTLGGCQPGEAKITGAYLLPCRFVIHTVGPIWQGGTANEEALLQSCYIKSLELAERASCHSIAFPLISAGAYGFPNNKAFDIAVSAIENWLDMHEMNVILVLFDRKSFNIGESRFSEIQKYIDDNYVNEHTDAPATFRQRKKSASFFIKESVNGLPCDACLCAAPGQSLEDYVNNQDESFTQMLLRKIDESGMKDAECYKRANISRKLFSKIRSNLYYQPSKPTVIAFAVSLKLPFSDTSELLRKAGFALSHSSKFDLIVEYFISNGIYDIYQINEALFSFDQVLLGG